MSRLSACAAWLAALLVPAFYLACYTPYGMDTTDFGYFYGYAWRILEGQIPYRDFSYIKPALPLYWHAFWLGITPMQWEVLGGKAGFLAEILAASWFGALFINKFTDLARLGATLPLLATTGFVFGIHSFPHMPWHTADGVFFSSLALLFSAGRLTAAGGLAAACAVLCKQSFALVPVAILIWLIMARRGRLQCVCFLGAFLAALALAMLYLCHNGALAAFVRMTTGQLSWQEAMDAGILIYARQNWILPGCALLPWLASRLARVRQPEVLRPAWCYLAGLTVWYIAEAHIRKQWPGFGTSWPTLFMLLGALCVFWPARFMDPYARQPGKLANSAAFAASLVCAWSVAISGGYKIPAFFAIPLIYSFFLAHGAIGGNTRALAFGTLLAGLLFFGYGYQYPYVFPVRPLVRADLKYDAGDVYPNAKGVLVDKDMLERLRELKRLREKYGAAYKTMPGFSFAYFLNRDYPAYSSDWLIDWEINGETDRLYDELLRKRLVVFMERDQLDQIRADAYDRAGYTVPQKVRHNWRVLEETPHFIVFGPPDWPRKIIFQ